MQLLGVRAVRLKIAASIGLAMVLGMASFAAAAASDPAPDEPTVDLQPVESGTEVTDEPLAADDAPALPDEPASGEPATGAPPDTAAPPAAAPCLTHGQRVSAIAHSTPPGPGHGAAVSAAAHDHSGECGDDDESEVAEPPQTDPGDEDDQHVTEPAVPTEPPTSDDDDGGRHEREGDQGQSKNHGHGKG